MAAVRCGSTVRRSIIASSSIKPGENINQTVFLSSGVYVRSIAFFLLQGRGFVFSSTLHEPPPDFRQRDGVQTIDV